MARGFLYVYERIYKGETEMQAEFRKIPVNGKRTSVADQKRVRKIISDNAYRIAQECSVLVSYPKMRIEGTAVNLGDVHIMLPDCRIISIEELKKIEVRRHKETEEEAVKRRQQMYGCNGRCCDRVIDPETGEGQRFICGGIDTCDETRVGEFIGMVGAVLFIVLAPIMFIAGIVALIVFGI